MKIEYYVPELIEHLPDGTIDCIDYDDPCMTLAEARNVCKLTSIRPRYNSIVKLQETDDGDITVLARRRYTLRKPKNAIEAFADYMNRNEFCVGLGVVKTFVKRARDAGLIQSGGRPIGYFVP